ncbi:mannosyltransferase putative-domain-containing protein [Scheffersomyces coipomensis]|uniref:mannosyltransferase putative-domain-containing protein n=1 Tax=Scheffersomyces coipomensis TaxID=1788519 RepID=UPI00315D9438
MKQIFRTKFKLIHYCGVMLALIIINIWIYNYSSSTPSTLQSQFKYSHQGGADSIYQLSHNEDLIPEEIVDKQLIEQFPFELLHKQFEVKDIKQQYDAHATIYDLIFKNHEPLSVFANLDFNQRCQLYFYNLYTNDHNWVINPTEKLDLENVNNFEFIDYSESQRDDLKKQFIEKNELGIEVDDLEETQEFEEFVNKKYSEFWERNQIVEQTVVDYISHLRIFNKCFIANNELKGTKPVKKFIADQKALIQDWVKVQKTDLKNKDPKLAKKVTKIPEFKLTHAESLIDFDSFRNCAVLESRVYPWLSFDYPVYERWTGDVVLKPPKMSNYLKPNTAASKTTKSSASQMHDGSCFLEKFKRETNGKGITLSISDSHVPDTIRLIHLLRALNNKLPIQIVYYENLSADSKKRLVTAAREQISSLPASFRKVAHLFPSDYLDKNDHGLPKQEIWFVNVYNVIKEDYRKRFEKFGNKFLATVFNSFDEFILLDADSVMVQSPEFFFDLEGYKQNGAYFFKDRTASTTRKVSDGTFFKKISPSIVDQTMFNIPIITDYTAKRSFFEGMYHYMESGLVVFDRTRHFNSMLLMIQLNFMEPVTSRVYGDKEIFWLAFALNGDEEFTFNKYHAAAIGDESPENEFLTKDGNPRKGHEVCAAHPGHISGEDGQSLLWFNSGFKFCGQNHKVDFSKEFENKSHFKFLKSIQDMKFFYTQPIPIKHAVIPPFKSKNELTCENIEDQPSLGWIENKDYCHSYLWCAYSQIGGTTESGVDNTQHGRFIEFDKLTQSLFQYYGDIWVGNE